MYEERFAWHGFSCSLRQERYTSALVFFLSSYEEEGIQKGLSQTQEILNYTSIVRVSRFFIYLRRLEIDFRISFEVEFRMSLQQVQYSKGQYPAEKSTPKFIRETQDMLTEINLLLHE